jgi:hypothetical protein
MRRPSWSLLVLLVVLAACGGGGGGGSGGGGDGSGSPSALGAELRWNAIAGAEGFVIHWGTEPQVYTDALDVGMPPVENGTVVFFLDGLDAATTYVFALTAYDTAGNESGFSNELVVAIP